jgi:aryl-alcohol dehydrogenase
MEVQVQGRFPLERLVKQSEFWQVNHAIDDSDNGSTVKPVLRMGT